MCPDWELQYLDTKDMQVADKRMMFSIAACDIPEAKSYESQG